MFIQFCSTIWALAPCGEIRRWRGRYHRFSFPPQQHDAEMGVSHRDIRATANTGQFLWWSWGIGCYRFAIDPWKKHWRNEHLLIMRMHLCWRCHVCRWSLNTETLRRDSETCSHRRLVSSPISSPTVWGDVFNPIKYGPCVRRTKSHLANMPQPDAGVVARGAGHPGMNWKYGRLTSQCMKKNKTVELILHSTATVTTMSLPLSAVATAATSINHFLLRIIIIVMNALSLIMHHYSYLEVSPT